VLRGNAKRSNGEANNVVVTLSGGRRAVRGDRGALLRCLWRCSVHRAPHPLANRRERAATGRAPVMSVRRTRRAVATASVERDHGTSGIDRYVMRLAGT
jgi:hypothetical protein